MSDTTQERTLAQLLEKISEAFPDSFVNKVLDQDSLDLERFNLSESLAAYIIREVHELYDDKSTGKANAERVRASLARSAHILETISKRLSDYSDAPAI